MKNIFVLFAIFCFCCNNTPKSTVTKGLAVKPENNNTKNITSSEIPLELLDYLKSALPNYRPPNNNQYIEGWKDFAPGNESPFFCKGDFDGNSSTDFAMVLIGNDSLLHLISFLIVEKEFRMIAIDKYKKSSKNIDAILSIQRKGVWETFDEKIIVPYDGITIDFIDESKSISYYWNNNQFIKVLFD